MLLCRPAIVHASQESDSPEHAALCHAPRLLADAVEAIFRESRPGHLPPISIRVCFGKFEPVGLWLLPFDSPPAPGRRVPCYVGQPATFQGEISTDRSLWVCNS